jgi:hypothetical protein
MNNIRNCDSYITSKTYLKMGSESADWSNLDQRRDK